VGTSWGLGHTAALLIAGIAVIGLKLTISRQVSFWMETAVAAMLVVLGARAVRTAMKGWRLHRHRHTHDGREHSHFHIHRPQEQPTHEHAHAIGVGLRPFIVGVVHGFAGSAGLMLLVLGTIPSALAGLAYIAIFGLGSTGGMLLMSTLISLPFVWSSGRFQLLTQVLQIVVGFGSIVFGCLYGYAQLLPPH